jgi:hypothetical protein
VSFDLARGLVSAAVPSVLKNVSGKKAERLLSAVSAVAVLAALCAPAWQTEASSPGGSAIGALLVLLALRFSAANAPNPHESAPPKSTRGARSSDAPPRAAADAEGGALAPSFLPIVGLILGTAASYEPLAFAAALAAAAPALWRLRARLNLHAGCMFLIGLLPLAIGFAVTRRPPEIALLVPAIEHSGAMGPIGFALGELGVVLLVVAAAGAALSMATRAQALPIFLTAGVGALALVVHAPAGPNRYAAAVLAGMVALYILMSTALAVIVLAIARLRIPFAEASAAMIVLLELVLPVRAADEALSRRDARWSNSAAIWNDVAWSSAPPAAIVLVHDRGTLGRIAAAKATGDFRADLVVVPAFEVQSRAGEHALLAEPKLAPLYRDMALDVPPEELSLSQLGNERPVLANFDPKWDRSLARHLVPIGLTARFEPEPRGASDRTKALETFTGLKERLIRIVRKDPELAAATATLLRARAIGMAATGEREVLSKALDDLRAFAPDDPVGTLLVRRLVTTKGAIDVHDLKPY